MKMNRISVLAGIAITALLLFAFPNAGLSGDWLEQYIAAAAISAGQSVDLDNPNKPSLDVFLRVKNTDDENQKTFNGQTYMPLEGME